MVNSEGKIQRRGRTLREDGVWSAEVLGQSQLMSAQRQFQRGFELQVGDCWVTWRMPDPKLILVSGKHCDRTLPGEWVQSQLFINSFQNKPEGKNHLRDSHLLAPVVSFLYRWLTKSTNGERIPVLFFAFFSPVIVGD